MKAGTKARGTRNNKRIGGIISAKLMVLALFTAVSMLCLAPALFADQAMMAKEVGSMCGDYSWTFDSDLSDIADYGDDSSPELVDYDADGQLELVMGYLDGDIRTFQYNESASPKWQPDQLVLNESTSNTYRAVSAIDFDKDGDYDLISSVRTGEIYYYENYGTRTQPNWTYKRAILHPNVTYSNFNAFADAVDFNRDGYYDILIGTTQSNGIIDYYENVAKEYAIRFEPFTEQFLDDIGSYTQCAFIDIDDEGVLDMICSRNSQTLYKFENEGNTTEAEWGDVEIFLNTGSGSQKYFSFGDLDNDTDYDLMIGDDGGNVYYYENTGTKQKSIFSSGTDVFGFSLGTYTAPSLVDIDDDGDLDLYVGEDNNNELKFYNNTGNATDYSFTVVTSMVISVGADRPVPYAVDLDNDNDYDLVVGVLGGQARFYENAGTAQSPSFSSYESLIDVGDYAAVGFGDIDNDSDLDMAIGNKKGYSMFYYNSGNSTDVSINSTIPQFVFSFMPENDKIHITMHDVDFDGDLDLIWGRADEPNIGSYYRNTVWLYENTGSNLYPEFSETAKWDGFSGGIGAVYAAMGDLDNDGDLDFIANTDSSGRYIKYYENVGNEFSYNWSGMTENYLGIDVGTYSVPYAVDFDLDGDIDVIIGGDDGYINYMRNDGNSTEANFTDAGLLQNTSLVNIDVGYYSCPAAADMDADGDIDLVIGDRFLHKIGYWQNNGTGYFSLASSDILPGKVDGNKNYPCPRLKDIDGDGDYDMVVGVDEYVYMILNIGTNQSPSWGSHTVLIDESSGGGVGRLDYWVVPALYDINNDSVIDIIAGDGRGSTPYSVDLLVFKHYDSNTSTTLDKVYNYFNGSFKYWWTPNWSDDRDSGYVAPTFGDLNGDGLPDLLIGRYDGEVDYIENYGRFTDNTSIMRNIAFIKQSDDMLGGYIDGEPYLGPMALDLYDIDNDNDLDIFAYAYYYESLNTYRSYLYLLRNIGTAETYLFNPDEAELIYRTNEFHCPTSSTRGEPWPTSLNIVDFDGDGDGDISMGIGARRIADYGYGKTKLFINNGTIVEPSFEEIIAGNQKDCSSDSILPDQGWWPSSYLYDADNDGDMDAFVCTKRGYCILLENKGVYTDPDDIADNTRFIKKIPDLVGNVSSGTSYSVSPRAVDLDGDGDYDLAVAIRSSVDDNKIKYYENKGTTSNPNFELKSTTSLSSDWYPMPAFGDIDNDGDNDIISGESTGVLEAYRNDGIYENNTCVTIVNTTLEGEPGVSVTFENSSGTVCSVTTGNNGKAECNISYNDDEIRIFVSGVNDPYRILASSYVDEGRSSTNAELETSASSSKIALNRMLFNIFSPGDYQPSTTKVYIGDSSQTMFNGVADSSGILNAWLPKKYIVFKNEPYTQNRITYDIEVFGNEKYDRVLGINDIYTPNKINLSSSTESRKLYKFVASEQMATGARYKVHVLYPAYTAQQKYNITDTVNGNLTIIGNVTVSYMGESCSIVPGTNSYSVDYTDKGCDFLEDAVEGNGEWVKVEYMIETPSLATFESEGWSTQDFISDPAIIRLIS